MRGNRLIEVVATEADEGSRLDKVLASHIGELSRARIQALLEDGQVSSRGEPERLARRKVAAGERFVVALPEPAVAAPLGEAIPLSVLHEDSELIVIDKPAGLVVHPAAGHATGTLVNALIAHCGDSLSGIGGVKRPGIVHRLDKDTSGVMVVAKTDHAHRALQAQFEAHGADGKLERGYLCVVWGGLDRRQGRISAPLHRKPSNRLKIAVARDDEGRAAATNYSVIETFADAKGRTVASLLACRLETGRTHQIRVHMAHIGHPLLGDRTYGMGFKSSAARLTAPQKAALARLGRQALHAALLAFEHPTSGRKLKFESALPVDLGDLIAALRRS